MGWWIKLVCILVVRILVCIFLSFTIILIPKVITYKKQSCLCDSLIITLFSKVLDYVKDVLIISAVYLVKHAQETTKVITGFAQSVEVCKPVFPSELENRDKDKVLAPVV